MERWCVGWLVELGIFFAGVNMNKICGSNHHLGPGMNRMSDIHVFLGAKMFESTTG